MKTLIIIPAFNEQDNIKRVVDNIRLHYSQYSYIIICDGSEDATVNICKENVTVQNPL